VRSALPQPSAVLVAVAVPRCDGRGVSVQDPELAVDLARDVLGQVAPEELPLFGVTSELYRRDPGAVEAQAGSEEMLGFGAEVIAAMTPIVLSVAGAVVNVLLDQVRAAAAAESEGVVRSMVHRLFRSFGASSDAGEDRSVALTKDQLRAVRQVAVDRARALKLPDAEAELLAEAMVGSLATA
jgi:hypothetical protein